MATRKSPAKRDDSNSGPPLPRAGAASAAGPSPSSASASGGPGDLSDASRGYTVLARRYRSRSFDEVVGQDPIARTLKNAIAQSRVAHAYLFCGTRGVGKTSMARIFAAALNVGGQSEAEAIRGAIMRGQDMDVIEIDGASNRGIDDARDLIAAAGIAPARSPYKVYIIDEVHMLTTPAFNALLKTMEEPPAQVKFILCTTEPHKVPATIQSRCQRFDFRAIPMAAIGAHLRDIFGREGIRAEEEVVRVIARQANGSMRDALSLADRLIAASEGELTRSLAEEVLGLPDEERVADLVVAIRAGDAASALDRAAALLEQGIPVERALELLADRYRTLLLAAVCGIDSPLIEVGPEARAAIQGQVAGAAPESLVHHIALCDAAARHARSASSPRTILDATVARLALADRFTPISEALRTTAGPGPGPGAPPAARATPPAPVMPGSRSTPPAPATTPRPTAAAPLTPSARPAPSAPTGTSAPTPAGAPSATPPATQPAPAASQKKTALSGAELVSAREAVIAHPVVRRAIDLFDANIVRIERVHRAEEVSDPAPEDREEAHPPS